MFVGDPLGAGVAEFQNGEVLGVAAKDAVGGMDELRQLFGFGAVGVVAYDVGGADVVDGKLAQGIAVMAMGDQIPVVAVIKQLLRRNITPGGGVFGTRTVMDVELFARK